MSELLVVKAKLKDEAEKIAGKKINVSGDFAAKLSEKVEQLIKDAVERAKANGRNTVMAKDV